MSKPISLEMVKQAGVLLKQEHELRKEADAKILAHDLEKRATKIAFREVELGYNEPFSSYDELMEKVASLMKEDLDVLEKALERGYGPGGNVKGGELAEDLKKTASSNPLHNWVMNGILE